MLQAGGSGYVGKRSADTELIEAIRTVHAGGVFLYHSAARMLLEDYLKRSFHHRSELVQYALRNGLLRPE